MIPVTTALERNGASATLGRQCVLFPVKFPTQAPQDGSAKHPLNYGDTVHC